MTRRMQMLGGRLRLDAGQERVLTGSPEVMLRFVIGAMREYAQAMNLPDKFVEHIRGTVEENADGTARLRVWNTWMRSDDLTGRPVDLGSIYESGAAPHDILPRRKKALKWSEYTVTAQESHLLNPNRPGEAVPGEEYAVFSRGVRHPGTPAHHAMKRGYHAGMRRYKRWVESGLSYSEFVERHQSQRRVHTAVRKRGPVRPPASPRYSRKARDEFRRRLALLDGRMAEMSAHGNRIIGHRREANRTLERRLESLNRSPRHRRMRRSIERRMRENEEAIYYWKTELGHARAYHAEARAALFGEWASTGKSVVRGSFERAWKSMQRAPHGKWHEAREAGEAARAAASRALRALTSARGMETRVRRASARERFAAPSPAFRGRAAQKRSTLSQLRDRVPAGSPAARALEVVERAVRGKKRRSVYENPISAPLFPLDSPFQGTPSRRAVRSRLPRGFSRVVGRPTHISRRAYPRVARVSDPRDRPGPIPREAAASGGETAHPSGPAIGGILPQGAGRPRVVGHAAGEKRRARHADAQMLNMQRGTLLLNAEIKKGNINMRVIGRRTVTGVKLRRQLRDYLAAGHDPAKVAKWANEMTEHLARRSEKANAARRAGAERRKRENVKNVSRQRTQYAREVRRRMRGDA